MRHNDNPVTDTGTPVLANYILEPDLAKELGVTTRTFRAWKAMGETPVATCIGQRVYYHRDDIDKWLKTDRRREVA